MEVLRGAAAAATEAPRASGDERPTDLLGAVTRNCLCCFDFPPPSCKRREEREEREGSLWEFILSGEWPFQRRSAERGRCKLGHFGSKLVFEFTAGRYLSLRGG